jgi:DDE superfamily endonuclease
MLHLPARFATVILPFAAMFVQQRTWRHAQTLLLGALLAPGQRTVCAILRIAGLCREQHFVNYHRVLNRAVWHDRLGTRLLLDLLVAAFVPCGPVLLGIDDTIERRRGERIKAKGIYRDPVCSSQSFFVKTSGLRWLSLMLLTPVSWARRVWALPFLTVLAPSARYCRERGQRHKALTDWARQIALQTHRWLPARTLVLIGDSSFAALELLAALVRYRLICVTRLRLDAALYEPAPPRQPGAKGRPRKKGARLPTLAQRLADAATAGVPSPSSAGMASQRVGWRSVPIPRCGSTAARCRCPSAGCWCAIRTLSSTHRRCCAPIPPVSRWKSPAGSSSAGRWK